MNRIKNYVAQFHPIVWVLLIGTVLARGASFMTLPFLSIYLSKNLHLHPIVIGLTVGMSPLMATIGGFIGGHLSDRFGRKPIMLSALFVWAFVFYGFMIAKDPIVFILLNALNGLCNSFFEPTSQALMADLTETKKRMKAYSMRYTAINIGASVGPLLGAYLASTSAKSTFLITGTMYLIYAIVLTIIMKQLKISNHNQSKHQVRIADAFLIIRKDKALRYLILGVILINAGYAQIESTLPQYLGSSIQNGVFIYSALLSINAVTVVVLQMPISHLAEKFRPMQVMMAGAILMALGLFSFSFVSGWVTAVVAILILTLGEILVFPSNSLLIDQLAEEQLRGTYFGAGQFRKIGHFLGPILGGYLLSHTGGSLLFIIIAIITFGSVLFFHYGNQEYVKVMAPVYKENA
ncbi:MDR family MFS transporter [Cytobacillus sp. Hz8]|uniref:MDR family MFS transporter n=1 Tax=Cytobacillus sp. Hz8 TaxID=3347168 RepID=UPI0035DE142F